MGLKGLNRNATIFIRMANMSYGNPVGTHLLLNVYDIQTPHLLEQLTRGLPLLREIVREMNLTVVSEAGFQFPPVGYTYAFVLSESHFTIHTYPEYQSCYIDIFCCNPEFDPLYAVDFIKRRFGTDNARHQVIRR